ncbi:hypothetical protein [Variovorax sp. RA8]|uniref:hypothetical protein n=1 Tax=Variovorax sp. (strain JCM 16519 / RA8) TaxID=662548 RepID=UPI001318101C|nr:hypothetical protein [Variovorax sp. RA8]VTU23314.1 hypothetical protein RA8CHR_02708 [Variovorax sp. RA8]
MSLTRSTFFKWAAAGAVAAGALFTAASANARGDVSWSVGISAPGVAVGVAAPPVYYAPPPVYYRPAAPVYYAPPPPVYYRPAPVYYGPPPAYYGPPRGYYRGHGHRHGHWR